ncbi:hypothetical protein DRW42_02085 [Pedobacter miscanthi]|uniref:Uncharacterized protein n=1 Tax=Pedobacter miscanthi TaxID=2259170 RepID=A0A366LE71_9SPHI|nr:hypothetical protein DRW42_02085 [Pedobacter miscanthi]
MAVSHGEVAVPRGEMPYVAGLQPLMLVFLCGCFFLSAGCCFQQPFGNLTSVGKYVLFAGIDAFLMYTGVLCFVYRMFN